MSDAAYTTFAGLNQALESRWTIRKKCQAVELCLDANMYASSKRMHLFAHWHASRTTPEMTTLVCMQRQLPWVLRAVLLSASEADLWL